MTAVPGLFYFENVLSAEESVEIIDALDNASPGWVGVTPSIKSRKVQQYGYTYDYIRRKVRPVFEWCKREAGQGVVYAL